MEDLRSVVEPGVVPGAHVVGELGLRVFKEDGLVFGRGEALAEASVPGTDVLRTSVLATWADVLTGCVAGEAVAPRIPLTLDLEVQVVAPVRTGTVVEVAATAVRVGRTIAVTTAKFLDATSGRLLAVSFTSFVPSPDASAVFTDGFPVPVLDGRLSVAFAERIGARLLKSGVVEVPHRPDGLNAVGAIQGGLLAFAAEEAASSLSPEPVVAESLVLRYLRPFMVGPARAVATGEGPGFSVVQVSDAGADKLGLVATVRTRIPSR
jgi:acyl-coenzyme A thioesterase PaaI-like protein